MTPAITPMVHLLAGRRADTVALELGSGTSREQDVVLTIVSMSVLLFL